MAQKVYLTLEIDGRDIEGECQQTGREGTIECSSFHCGLKIPYEPESGRLTGERQHGPVKIFKRIDKTTPFLARALCQNDPVTRAEFRFLRFEPRTRTYLDFFTVVGEDGHIFSLDQASEDEIMAGEQARPAMEEVGFVFRHITWRSETDRVEYRSSLA